MTYRWFGREPALILSAVAIALTLVIGFGIPSLSDRLAAVLIAIVVAAAGGLVATFTRPVGPAVFAALAAAGFALAQGLWFDLAQRPTAFQTSLLVAVLALLIRPQQAPVDPRRP